MNDCKYKNNFLIITLSVKSQNSSSPFLMRASLSASGSSETISFSNLNFKIQQSIDQVSVIYP